MKKGFLKIRMSKITAWLMSIILTCSSVSVPVHAEVDRTLDRGVSDVSLLEKTQYDVTPGDVMLGDVSSRDITPGDVTPGNATNHDVIHNDETSNNETSADITPGTIASYFPDKNLAAAVAEKMYKKVDSPVTQEELDGVPLLSIDTVTDWTGVEKLTNLNSVTLQPTSAYDIANLAGLADVLKEEITLNIYSYNSEDENIHGDISVLGMLPNLVSLYIGYDTALFGDISSLSDLKKLKSLSIGWQSSDKDGIKGSLQDLQGLVNLEYLNINNYNITGDISAFSKMTSLYSLSLYNTNVSGNIGDLALLENLEYLYLNDTRVSGDFSELGPSTKLHSLNLSGTSVRTKPADAELFPNLNVDLDMFTLPMINVANSILTYDRESYSFPGISIKTNKYNNSLANVTINGEIISATNDSGEANYTLDSYYDWNEEMRTSVKSGNLTFSIDFLKTFTPGTYDFKLDFYWGGEVSGRFTIESTGKTLNELFPDKYLANAVAARLGIIDMTTLVTEGRLQDVDWLTIDTVTDWSGVEKLTNLNSVTLQPTSIYDIANMAGLAKAPQEELTLYIESYSLSEGENIHGDLTVLGKLPNLVSLNLGNNTSLSGDIRSLSNLKRLKNLSIGWQSSDKDGIKGSLQDLQDLVSLESLQINNYNTTGDIGDLASLENLEHIDLNNTKVSGDLSDLGPSTKLNRLYLFGTTVRTKPSDAELFPNLYAHQDMFTLPTIDIVNSILTYDRDSYSNLGISFKTNKSNYSLGNVMINGEITSSTNDSGEANYTLNSYAEWNEEKQTYDMLGKFSFSLDFLNTCARHLRFYIGLLLGR
jgi:hypothetical protein